MTTFRDDLAGHALGVLLLLGNSLDVDLSLDQGGACYFEHDDGWRLALMLTGEDQVVAAVSVLSGIEALSAEALAAILTDLNWLGARTGGAALSWNPESRSFLLWRSQDVEGLTAAVLNATLLRLVRAAGEVLPLLQAELAVAASPHAAALPADLTQRV